MTINLSPMIMCRAEHLAIVLLVLSLLGCSTTPPPRLSASSATPTPDAVKVRKLKEALPPESAVSEQRIYLNGLIDKTFLSLVLSGSDHAAQWDTFAKSLVEKARQAKLNATTLQSVLGAVRSSRRGFLPVGAYSTECDREPVWIIVTQGDGHYTIFAYTAKGLREVGGSTCK